MKNITIRIAVALLRLAGCRVNYTVSRRNVATTGRGFGRTLFASQSLTSANRKSKTIRQADNDTVFVRLDCTITANLKQESANDTD